MDDRMTGNDRQNENGGLQISIQSGKARPPKYDRQKAVSGLVVAGLDPSSGAGYRAKNYDRRNLSLKREKTLAGHKRFTLSSRLLTGGGAFLK